MSSKRVTVIINAKNALKGGLQSSAKSIRRFEGEFKKSNKKVEKSSSRTVNKIKSDWLSLKTVFIGIAAFGFGKILANSLGAGAKLVLKPVIELETYKTQFSVLFKSLPKAEKRIKELIDFAATTPFQIKGVVAASKQLEVMTRGALSTGKGLRLVGDIAAGTAKTSEELSWQFQNVSMWVGRLYDGLKSGRPVGEAMMRLSEMGVVSGDTRNKMEELSKSGESFTKMWSVFEKDAGRFSGTTKAVADTLGGLISTLKDNATLALAEFGDALGKDLKPIIEDTTKKIQEFVKDGSFKEWGMEAAGTLKTVIDTLRTGIDFLREHGDKIKLGAKIFIAIKALQTVSGLITKVGAKIKDSNGQDSAFDKMLGRSTAADLDKLNKKFSGLNINQLEAQMIRVKKGMSAIHNIKQVDISAKDSIDKRTEEKFANNKEVKMAEAAAKVAEKQDAARQSKAEKMASKEISLREASENKIQKQKKSQEEQKRKLEDKRMKDDLALLDKAEKLAKKEQAQLNAALDKEENLLRKAESQAKARVKAEDAAKKQKDAASQQNTAADKQLKAAGHKVPQGNERTVGEIDAADKLKKYTAEEEQKLRNKSDTTEEDPALRKLTEKKLKQLKRERDNEEAVQAAKDELANKKKQSDIEEKKAAEKAKNRRVAQIKKELELDDQIAAAKKDLAKKQLEHSKLKAAPRDPRNKSHGLDGSKFESGSQRELASRFKRSFSDRDNEVRSTSKGGIHYDALDEAGNRQSRFIKEEKKPNKYFREQRKAIGSYTKKFGSKIGKLGDSFHGLQDKLSGLMGVVGMGVGVFGGAWAAGRVFANAIGSDKFIEGIYNKITFQRNNDKETSSAGKDSKDFGVADVFKKSKKLADQRAEKAAIEADEKKYQAQKKADTEKRLFDSEGEKQKRAFSDFKSSNFADGIKSRSNKKAKQRAEGEGIVHAGRDVKLKHRREDVSEEIVKNEKLLARTGEVRYQNRLKHLNAEKASLDVLENYRQTLRSVGPELDKEVGSIVTQIAALRKKRSEVEKIQKLSEMNMKLGFEDSVDSLIEVNSKLKASQNIGSDLVKTWKNQIKESETQLGIEVNKLKVKRNYMNVEAQVSGELALQRVQLEIQLKLQKQRNSSAKEILENARLELNLAISKKKTELGILRDRIKSGQLAKKMMLDSKESSVREQAEAKINLAIKQQGLNSGTALDAEKSRLDISVKEAAIQDKILTRLENQGYMTDRLVAKNKELSSSRKESLKTLEEEAKQMRGLGSRDITEMKRGKRNQDRFDDRYERGLARSAKQGGFSLDADGNIQTSKTGIRGSGISRGRRAEVENYLKRKQIKEQDKKQQESERIAELKNKNGFTVDANGRLRSDKANNVSTGDRRKIKASILNQRKKEKSEKEAAKKEAMADAKHRANEAAIFGDNRSSDRIKRAKRAARKRQPTDQELENDPTKMAVLSYRALQAIQKNTEGSIGL